jgi:hypothetical protein
MAPCACCGRHVRADANACPFCDAELTPAPRRPISQAFREHVSRAAILAGAAALAAPGCFIYTQDDQVQRPLPTVVDAGAAMAVDPVDAGYAMPPPDAAPAALVVASPDAAVVSEAEKKRLADERERKLREDEQRQLDEERRLDKDMDWRNRRRNCDRCPYGAAPLPHDRAIV